MDPATFRAYRIASGLSQADIAAIFGVADRSVRRWETTHRPPADVVAYVQQTWQRTLATAAELAARTPDDATTIGVPEPQPASPDTTTWTIGMQDQTLTALFALKPGTRFSINKPNPHPSGDHRPTIIIDPGTVGESPKETA